MSIKARLLSGGMWVIGGRMLTLIAAFIINMLLARLLDSEDLGTYFLLVSMVNILSVIGLFGMNRLVVRLIAEKLSSTVQSSIKIILRKSIFVVTTATIVVIGLYWFILQDWLGGKVLSGVNVNQLKQYVAIWILLWVTQTFIAEALRGFHDIRAATIFGGLLFNSVFVVLLLFVWLLQYSIGLEAVLIMLIGSLLLNALFAALTLFSRQKSIVSNGLVGNGGFYLGSGFYMLLTSVSLLLITDVHLWIVGYFHEEIEVAHYGAAFRLLNLLVLPLTMINMLISSSVAQLYSEGRATKLRWLMSTSAVVAGVPAIIALFAAMYWSEGLLGIVYGDLYRAAAPVVYVLVFGHIINAVTGSPGVLLMMAGNEKYVMIFSAGSAIAGIIISLLLTPKYGAVGAAYGTAITIALHNISMWFYSLRKLGIDTRLRLASIVDLYKKIRIEIEVLANNGRFGEKIERFIRLVEMFFWKVRRIEVIDCFGDSHARIFRMLNGHNALSKYRFRTIVVRGATMFGLGNPNSKTNALKIFKEWLERSPRRRPIMFLLGEVDMGFLIWWRAKKHGLDPDEAFKEAVKRYQQFLLEVQTRHEKIIVVSAPLPTIPDGGMVGEVAAARREVDASQIERTEVTLKFNAIMKKWCLNANMYFVDMDEFSLDKDSMLVRPNLLNENSEDHHYNQKEFVELLAKSIVQSEIL